MALKVFLGLAKDEMLLLGAVSMSLGSVGYIAVPWGTVMAGPSDKAVALYEEIEAANMAYFEKYGLWPHEVTSGAATDNVAVLMSRVPLTRGFAENRAYQPVMEGRLDIVGDGVVLRHAFGAGGMVGQFALNGGDYRYVIQFDGLTMADAKALDEVVDGEFSPSKGRVRVVEEGGEVVVKYLANKKKI